MMIRLGITGNMGSGKSLATAYLAELGAAVIDADKIGHQIILKGCPAYTPLIKAFGSAFLKEDGEFDRRALGEYVFADKSGKRGLRLNSITHPLIRAEIRKRLAANAHAGYALTVIEAAVLFEGKMAELMDRIWLITAPRNQLIERVKKRDDFSEETIEARLNRQMDEEEMAKLTDLVIINDGTVERFREKITCAYHKLLKELS